jgi:hypothetical protein
VLVKLARIVAVRPPRELPTNKEFLRFSTTRFISRSETSLSIGTAPSLIQGVVDRFRHGMLRQQLLFPPQQLLPQLG